MGLDFLFSWANTLWEKYQSAPILRFHLLYEGKELHFKIINLGEKPFYLNRINWGRTDKKHSESLEYFEGVEIKRGRPFIFSVEPGHSIEYYTELKLIPVRGFQKSLPKRFKELLIERRDDIENPEMFKKYMKKTESNTGMKVSIGYIE